MMEAFTVFYSPEQAERVAFLAKLHGPYSPIYWATIVLNIAIPQLLWSRRVRLNPAAIVGICLGVIVGMWCERYTIVVMSLRRTDMPSAWGNYHGSFWDWALLFGSVGLFLTGILVAVRLIPVISMFEMRGMLRSRGARSGERA
jgi:molybdopterin-containing oxidoreductase family membrane subunit